MRDAMPQFWLWTFVALLAFGVIYWWYAANELEKQKSGVMARQRAFAVTLGPEVDPLRQRLESWTTGLAGTWRGNQIVAERSTIEQLSLSKGLYLRLLLEDATSAEKIGRAADRSLHDGFTSCLFVREPRVQSHDDPRCNNSADCDAGEICNEYDRCAAPTQPYNLRFMYRALRILSPTWTDELHQATNDYQVRVFDRDLDAVAKTDVPIALELVRQARYYTALLDEMPSEPLPEVAGIGEDGLDETPMEQLQAIPHTVRLGIWDLETGKQLVRWRTQAGATFIPLGDAAAAPLASRRARQRQINNCSIAEALREAVPASNAPAVPNWLREELEEKRLPGKAPEAGDSAVAPAAASAQVSPSAATGP